MTPAEMARIHAACFETPRPWNVREFTELSDAPGTFLCLAPQGFLWGRVVLDEAELLTLAVDPGARRQGIGAALTRDFLRRAADRGATRSFLEVAADNFAAQSLYAALGFSASGTRRNYYASPDGKKRDALVLTRPLP